MRNLVATMFVLCLSAFTVAAPAHAEKAAKGMPDEAAIKKMMALGAPGEHHQVLNGLVGNWDYTITFKMAPDAPEETLTGTSENKWILDGRFVQQTVSGAGMTGMDGKPQKFDGLGLMGHDNMKGEYSSVWVDNMNTGTMVSSGKYDAATKTIKESGQFSCPMRGAKVKFTGELQFVDDDHFTYTMYETGKGGKKFKSMEIKYTKQK